MSCTCRSNQCIGCQSDHPHNKDENIDITKFELWDTRWRLEHSKAQCSKDLTSSSSLPKCMRIVQAYTLTKSEGSIATTAIGLGIDPILWTMQNHQSTHIVDIPYKPIKQRRYLGKGSYGECAKVTIQGISFFPLETDYAANKYKETSTAKLIECMKEAWMQLHYPHDEASMGDSFSLCCFSIVLTLCK